MKCNKDKIYAVTITETLSRTVTVEAASKEQAIALARIQYENEDIVLDADDFLTYDIDAD